MDLWLDMDGLDRWRIWAICFAWKFGKLSSKRHPSFEQTNISIFWTREYNILSVSSFVFDVFRSTPSFWKKNNGMPRRRGFLLVQDFPKKESVWNLPPANYLLPWSSWTRATSITGVTKTLFKENQMPGWWVFPIHFIVKSRSLSIISLFLEQRITKRSEWNYHQLYLTPKKVGPGQTPGGISPCHH